MKNSIIALVVLVTAIIGLAGCGHKKADTSKLESSFAGAEATLKADIQKAVDAIKKDDYSAAMTELQKTFARSNAKLTEAQKAAIKGTLESLQKLIAEGANKSVQDAAAQTTKKLETAPKAVK
jgi:outer membrane lipopolysaccharide assembly protein LptE/RlpB